MPASGVRSSWAALALKARIRSAVAVRARRRSFVTDARSSHSSPVPRTGSSSSPSPFKALRARSAASRIGASARLASRRPRKAAPATTNGEKKSITSPIFFASWKSSPT